MDWIKIDHFRNCAMTIVFQPCCKRSREAAPPLVHFRGVSVQGSERLELVLSEGPELMYLHTPI